MCFQCRSVDVSEVIPRMPYSFTEIVLFAVALVKPECACPPAADRPNVLGTISDRVCFELASIAHNCDGKCADHLLTPLSAVVVLHHAGSTTPILPLICVHVLELRRVFERVQPPVEVQHYLRQWTIDGTRASALNLPPLGQANLAARLTGRLHLPSVLRDPLDLLEGIANPKLAVSSETHGFEFQACIAVGDPIGRDTERTY